MGFHNVDSEDPLAKSNFRFHPKSEVRGKSLLERPSSSKGAPSVARTSVCGVPACLAFSSGVYCVAHVGSGSDSRVS